MELNSPWDGEHLRLRVIIAVMFAGLLFLAGALWRVQVLHGLEHAARLDKQSIRRVRLPGLRGSITDRHGTVLAGNRPSYCLALYVEELRQPGRSRQTIDEVVRVIGEIGEIIGLPAQVNRNDVRTHIRRRLPLPFLAWRDLSPEALARWVESGVSFPGVDIHIEPVREYPRGTVAAHVLGCVGRAGLSKDEHEPYHFYLPDMQGQFGVERSFDARLAGLAGGRLIRVDASGFKHNEQFEREPQKGEDLRLTLDAEIQALAESLMEGWRGAFVLLDARNGDVVAMASSPAFAPSRLGSQYGSLRKDPALPLLNRAIEGQYPPGSTFKPLVAIAALENGGVSASARYDCPGYFELGGVPFRCWRRSGHGSIGMRKSIEQSCNVYYYQVGLKCGYDRIYHMADAVGFGHHTGIALDLEMKGLLPNDTWKRRVLKDGWRSGDTCNVSIGQGAILATPLQMALFASAVGNGGRIYTPRIVTEPWEEGDLVKEMAWSAGTLATVRGGMYDVVEAETGTGRRARIAGVPMGGKTGTAEYGPREARRKYAWMIAFAPYDNPQYGAAVILEDAESGGRTAAPRMARLMAGVFGSKPVFPSPEEEAAAAAAASGQEGVAL
ncbi:MAG: penicillin-binding protein 2 [Kiritimatiellia bacterium]|jgi:penicillin-binding protein 2|nr:penicillin-binding protein 2 [Kiritimatiellia bacterium]MDP6630021.1 penicillin-binding protein 2 [Kiritimatiellia bacterium]MDP6810974.1 penicillin-binding protein 2 [Kiritimatiellia bacterium]MDP7025227.1 penicillin-binding protein 2 [Kiritimatiellia bacterium]